MSIEVGCSAELSGSGNTVELDCDNASFEGELATKSVDMEGTVGAGVAFHAGAAQIQFDIRYTLGFVEVDDSPTRDRDKNGVLSVSVGVGVNLGS